MNAKKQPDEFRGSFTAHFREVLRERRLSMGLSFERLGDRLGINPSTLRKWESGKIEKCHARHIVKLAHFFKDDDGFGVGKDLYGPDGSLSVLWNQLPDRMHECMERAATLYNLCCRHPRHCERMMGGLSTAVTNAVIDLLKSQEDHE